MKVNLNKEEMATIIVAWAKKQYKTHNISVDFEVDVHPLGSIVKDIEAILEISLSADQIADTSSTLSEEHLRGLHNRLKGIENTTAMPEEPDFTPLFNADSIIV